MCGNVEIAFLKWCVSTNHEGQRRFILVSRLLPRFPNAFWSQSSNCCAGQLVSDCLLQYFLTYHPQIAVVFDRTLPDCRETIIIYILFPANEFRYVFDFVSADAFHNFTNCIALKRCLLLLSTYISTNCSCPKRNPNLHCITRFYPIGPRKFPGPSTLHNDPTSNHYHPSTFPHGLGEPLRWYIASLSIQSRA